MVNHNCNVTQTVNLMQIWANNVYFQMCFSLCDLMVHNTFIQVTQPRVHILCDHLDSKSNSNTSGPHRYTQWS